MEKDGSNDGLLVTQTLGMTDSSSHLVDQFRRDIITETFDKPIFSKDERNMSSLSFYHVGLCFTVLYSLPIHIPGSSRSETINKAAYIQEVDFQITQAWRFYVAVNLNIRDGKAPEDELKSFADICINFLCGNFKQFDSSGMVFLLSAFSSINYLIIGQGLALIGIKRDKTFEAIYDDVPEVRFNRFGVPISMPIGLAYDASHSHRVKNAANKRRDYNIKEYNDDDEVYLVTSFADSQRFLKRKGPVGLGTATLAKNLELSELGEKYGRHHATNEIVKYATCGHYNGKLNLGLMVINNFPNFTILWLLSSVMESLNSSYRVIGTHDAFHNHKSEKDVFLSMPYLMTFSYVACSESIFSRARLSKTYVESIDNEGEEAIQDFFENGCTATESRALNAFHSMPSTKSSADLKLMCNSFGTNDLDVTGYTVLNSNPEDAYILVNFYKALSDYVRDNQGIGPWDFSLCFARSLRGDVTVYFDEKYE